MMRSSVLISALTGIWLAAVTAAAAGPVEDVKAAYAKWDAAFNKGDAKAVAAFYEQDAVFLPLTHEVIMGADGVEKFFGGLFTMGVTDHKLELIDARGDDMMIVGTAKWSATGTDDKGAEQAWSGTAANVFRKQPDGSLKMTVHIFN